MKNYALILASGIGERIGLNIPKQFVKIAGKTILEHTICVFENHKDIDEIIITAHSNSIDFVESLVKKSGFKKVRSILEGGKTRKESSYIALNSICADDNDNVLIHDAVRPFLSSRIIDNCIEALKTHNAVDVAIPSADTIIITDESNFIKEIPKRKFFKRGQTPQCFKLGLIKKAHKMSLNDETSYDVTDDCSLIIKYNLSKIFVVDGDDFNRKITYPLDIAIADKLFQLKSIKSETKDKSELNNSVAVVFGYSQGIGLVTYNLLKENGAKVYGFSRSNGCNIKNSSDIERALKDVYDKEGKIDYIINTAGVLKKGKLTERNYDDIMDEISTNYIGSINVAKAGFKYLKESKGSILFYTSSSYTRGRADYSIYSSSKAALVNLVQGLSEEWVDYNIKVNIINPERTATPMRFKNFGKEPPETLLNPIKVAVASINTLLSNYTGQIINVTKEDI